jgi:hypothetical protein
MATRIPGSMSSDMGEQLASSRSGVPDCHRRKRRRTASYVRFDAWLGTTRSSSG